MSCDRCIVIDTPQSIMDEGNDYYPAETDIFETIFNMLSTTFVNASAMQAALWSKYRFYMLGSCCTDKWVRIMADRLEQIGERWDDIMTAAANGDLASLKELSYTRLIKRQPIPETEGDVRTTSYEHESLPQTQTSTTKYLDERSGTSDTYAPNTQDTETYDEERDVNAATFERMMQKYPRIPEAFADEFKDYFVERWY